MKSFRAVVFMFVLTLVFTGLVSLVKVINDDRIEKNQVVKMQRVVLKVLGLAEGKESTDEVLRLFTERVEPVKIKDRTMYVGYETKDRKKVKGYAFPVQGAGFWGQIYGMVAVTPKADRIMGLAFYKHSETPGLGARMTEKWFTDQFKTVKLHPLKGDEKFFYLKPPGPDHAPNELDAITGASRTTEAVENFLNSELKLFLDNYFKALQNEQGKNG